MKNHNYFARNGDPSVSDFEVAEAVGLGPEAAGPNIDELAIRKMHRQNYEGFVRQGMKAEDALNKADRLAGDARRRILPKI